MKLNKLTTNFCLNLQNHPTFHSAGRLVNLERGRECRIGLSKLLVYAVYLDSERLEKCLRLLDSAHLAIQAGHAHHLHLAR